MSHRDPGAGDGQVAQRIFPTGECFTDAMTLHEQMACVRREMRLCHGAYPVLVARGTLTQAQADAQIAGLTAVLRTLEELVDAQHDRGQPELFPREDPA